ncbi:hypothetical protein BN1723_014467 [Verticillium longisporum]|uniref:Autophagy-related protein 11 n=1 Tax=Verticillium longisporum TaxID=100787 RepID=A0A0G4MAA9_VERLO|nr:hypothetical protein BN1723_014467 [Verticillium longisporum]
MRYTGAPFVVRLGLQTEDDRIPVKPQPQHSRIQQLETDVAAERERSTVLEKDLLAQMTQHKDTKGQMEEANITKKDLLGNMEALKREFVEERKSLEDEIKTLKARIEDNEDEMENFGESRENEKATYDGRVSALDQEIERLRKEQKDETLKAQGQVEFLRNEARLQREQNESLEKQLQAALDENKTVLAELDISRESSDSQRKALRSLHEQLAPNDRLPEDMLDLIDATLARSAEVVARLQSSDNDKAVLKSNNEKMHEELTTLRDELAESQKQVATKEESAMHLRESLDEEKAKVSALEKDAAGARSQLDELRAKIAHGETGSESLRQQLDEVEQNARTISEELASKQSQVGSLEEELHMYREKLQVSQGHHSELTGRFDARTDHTKDLTQRIYAQNDRMCRLLERLGFAVTRDESSSAMTFTKVPRAERGSMSQTQVANDSSDPGQPSIRRSSTFQSRNLADSTDLELLYWMNSSEIGAEQNKYDAFMNKLGHFDMDQFAETIYRRVKDVEHLARKLQRDSRAYREKARSLQKDAHEKIAYKHFKEGDLALFLPTRNQSSGAWAAFNVGFPHYFLREQDNHRLRSREWLVARISRIEERVVDLSKSLHRQLPDTDSFNDEDDNPFQLSDGLRWYMIDAVEDKAGAPSTPGLGKSTIATNNDIEAVVGKIDTDAQIVQEYGQRELAQASKTAQNQTERLIPSLRKRAEEMDDMLVYATSARNAIAADAVDFMRTINGISNLHGNVKTQCQNLRESDEDMTTFDYLRLIHQLPYMYSSFVGEAIRRREWTEKVKTDSSTLANEMALFQDEESKRRKKWQKSIGSTYGPDSFSNTILGLEVNLLGEEEEWPVMAKPDLEEFLGHLKQQQTESALLEEVQELVNELNAPTKQQSKRVKAFKNGSIY